MRNQEISLEKASMWQLIFLQSKVNGARYNGEQLLGCSWNWPKNTYLQRRLQQLRWRHSSDESHSNRSTNPVVIEDRSRHQTQTARKPRRSNFRKALTQ